MLKWFHLGECQTVLINRSERNVFESQFNGDLRILKTSGGLLPEMCLFQFSESAYFPSHSFLCIPLSNTLCFKVIAGLQTSVCYELVMW